MPNRRPSLSSEQGSLMIEVLMGAVLLALATFAVLNGLDGAQATGHMNKQRSVSSTLAQQDIERLRAYPITALSNFSQTRSVNVAGVAYSVQSTTEWVRDSTDVLNCTDQTGQADYVKISSTVRSPAQTNAVKEVSLLTPAAGSLSDTHGTLAVKVTNRSGVGRSGATVALSGTSSHSKITNTLGCAVFDHIPIATYSIDVPGMVSWGGEGATKPQATVVAGKTSLAQVEMEPPASLKANLLKPDGTAAAWTSIQVANAKLPSGAKNFLVGSAASSIDGAGLFPFLDGYGVYAGTCQRNNPASWQGDYFQTSGKGFVTLNPSDFLKPVNVQMGLLNVNVKNSASTPVNMVGALVTVRQRDTQSGCNQDLLMASANTDASGNASFVLPFGTYRVCTSGFPDPARPTTTRVRQTSGTTGSTQDPRLRPPSNLTFNSALNITHGSTSQSPCPPDLDLSP
jgi:Tfp pilus assembly protein PilV